MNTLSKSTSRPKSIMTYLTLFFLGATGGTQVPYTSSISSFFGAHEGAIEVRFSPQGGCEQLVVDKIHEAITCIHISIFSFTSKVITDALLKAKQRGVKVFIIADNTQQNGHKIVELQEKIDGVYLYKGQGILHHKTTVIDKKIVLNGSFNYSKNAEKRNREVLVSFHLPELGNHFYTKWEKLKENRKVYEYGDLNRKK